MPVSMKTHRVTILLGKIRELNYEKSFTISFCYSYKFGGLLLIFPSCHAVSTRKEMSVIRLIVFSKLLGV